MESNSRNIRRVRQTRIGHTNKSSPTDNSGTAEATVRNPILHEERVTSVRVFSFCNMCSPPLSYILFVYLHQTLLSRISLYACFTHSVRSYILSLSLFLFFSYISLYLSLCSHFHRFLSTKKNVFRKNFKTSQEIEFFNL